MAIQQVRLNPFGSWLVKGRFNLTLRDGSHFLPGVESLDGLAWTRSIQEYIEGGVNDFVWKFPGQITYDDLIVRRKFTGSAGVKGFPLHDFFNNGMVAGVAARRSFDIVLYASIQQANDVRDANEAAGKETNFEKKAKLIAAAKKKSENNTMAVVQVINAVPIKYKLSGLKNEGGQTELREEMTLAHHGYVIEGVANKI